MTFQINRLFFLFLFLISVNIGYNQIKIGNNPQIIDTASLLELESSTRVLVISRVSTTNMLQIIPLAGSMVYNIDEQCIFFYDGLNWNNLCVPPVVVLPPAEPTEPTEPNDSLHVQITDNTDGTYTVGTEEGETFTIDTQVHKGTPGALFFGNVTDGEPINDGTNLFWDNENKRLGVGTNTPKQTLDVNGIIRSSRIFNGRGSTSYPGYHFQDNTSTGMFSLLRNILGFSTDGKEAMRIIGNGNVGIRVQNPLATLHVGGDLRVDGNIISTSGTYKTAPVNTHKNIRRISTEKVALTTVDETIILEESVRQVILPEAHIENAGLLFIIKILGSKEVVLNISYKNLASRDSNSLDRNSVVWLQSDGVEWQQLR